MAKQMIRSNSRSAAFALESSHAGKAQRGRTTVEETPLTVLAHGLELDRDIDSYVRERLSSKLGKFATHMERVSVRFSDLNGPKGGVDTECRVQVSLHPVPIVVVSARGTDPRRAFDSVANLVVRTVKRSLERAGFSEGSAKRASKKTRATPKTAESPAASENGRVARAAELRTGERNKRKKTSKAAVALEDSTTGKPSRKSTRKGANRLRSGQNLERKARDLVGEPQARAAAAGVRRK
ncbi:MAG TPA: HPF/RaiA family ribosome-associated protein [Planctomycetota bacterium]|nr:HPF/RaiA family ribosome-associated protein [Planctomycetota bacterium]